MGVGFSEGTGVSVVAGNPVKTVGLGVGDSAGASVEGTDVGEVCGASVLPSVTGAESAEGAGDLVPVGAAVGEAEGDGEGGGGGGVERAMSGETDALVVVVVGEYVCAYVGEVSLSIDV